MGKHKDRSRSRSRSKKKKHHHSRSRSKSNDRRDRRSEQVAEPPRRRQTKWSDQPAPAPEPSHQPDNHYFDTGVIRIAEPGNVSLDSDAINIASGADGGLKNTQRELFDKALRTKPGLGFRQSGGGGNSPTNFGMDDNAPFRIMEGLDQNFTQMNPHIAAALNDPSKIKRKINIPMDRNFNYAGVIIGPKGSNQKRLEEETGCKILVRGRGSQKDLNQPAQSDDGEPLHVLVVGDSEVQVNKAVQEIENVILAPPEVLNEIRQAQLRMVAKLKNDGGNKLGEESFKVAVPHDCIGLVIGKGGETIKMLQSESGARRVQVAQDKGEGMRHIYVEGDEDACLKVKAMIDKIVERHQIERIGKTGRLPNDEPAPRVELTVPDAFVGMVIGKNGQNIKDIKARTGANIVVPPQTESRADRVVTITGFPEAVERAKQEIEMIIAQGQRNQMIRQMTPMIMQQMMLQNMAAMGYDPYSQSGQNADPVIMNAMYSQMMESMSNMGNMEPAIANYYMQMMAAQQNQAQMAAAAGGDPNQMMMMNMMAQQQGGGMMPMQMGGMPGMQGMPGGQPPPHPQ